MTPEQRHALGIFLDDGGFVLLALGPRAAAAPLGATLDPMLAHGVSWSDTTQPGADPASAVGSLVESAHSLTELGASRRASLSQEDYAAFDPLLQWTDGSPLVARRSIGRGETWIVTLPFSVDTSDLTLRPAFLALLEEWVRAARERAAPQRSDVGTPWIFPGARDIDVQGPAGPLVVKRDNGVARVTPSLIGTYRIRVDGKVESRVAAPDVRELDLRPRAVDSSAHGRGLGERRASVDISGEVALALLALVALEIALRLWSRGRMAASA